MPKSTGENWMGTPEACEYLGIEPATLGHLLPPFEPSGEEGNDGTAAT